MVSTIASILSLDDGKISKLHEVIGAFAEETGPVSEKIQSEHVCRLLGSIEAVRQITCGGINGLFMNARTADLIGVSVPEASGRHLQYNRVVIDKSVPDKTVVIRPSANLGEMGDVVIQI